MGLGKGRVSSRKKKLSCRILFWIFSPRFSYLQKFWILLWNYFETRTVIRFSFTWLGVGLTEPQAHNQQVCARPGHLAGASSVVPNTENTQSSLTCRAEPVLKEFGVLGNGFLCKGLGRDKQRHPELMQDSEGS